jgi:hypothetical protein
MWHLHNKTLFAPLSHLKVGTTPEGGSRLVRVRICFTQNFFFVLLYLNQLIAEWMFDAKASHWALYKFSHSDDDYVFQSD